MASDARSERSRLALINAGMVMLTENRDATLSDVAQQAGVGRATLYRQFETKDALIKTIAETCLNTFDHATAHIERNASSWLDAIRLMFESVMPLHKELSFLMKLDGMIEEQSVKELCKQQEQEMLMLMKQCQAEKSVRTDVSAQWLVALMDGLFFAAWTMVSEHGCSHQDAASLAFKSFCHGVAQRG